MRQSDRHWRYSANWRRRRLLVALVAPQIGLGSLPFAAAELPDRGFEFVVVVVGSAAVGQRSRPSCPPVASKPEPSCCDGSLSTSEVGNLSARIRSSSSVPRALKPVVVSSLLLKG